MRNRRRTQGLTLIEVLVTSALFTLLLGLVSQFFVVQSRVASLQKAINEANEGTRTALALITWDLQNAGYRATLSSTNPTYISATNNGYTDTVTTRFFDVDQDPDAIRKVRYSIGQGSADPVVSLQRANFPDNETDPSQGMQSSIASMVVLNLRYETRQDPFVTPTSGFCPSGSTPVFDETGSTVVNCRINWVWADTPQRLVRSIKVQLLSRSEARVSRYTSPMQSYTFDGGGQYATEPDFVYHFAEQTVLVPNLGR